ncbi:DMSO/TMAO reductase YedYZ molybdopterin-dependent catalytic subunit [Pseudomonas duriflava]|uniref:DMSO/TMAO reductase YedYZ molybdopterin-dependent catalytic subunit n=1 Tax=Pseudomonas duriflava TaxID=459528 RepID=A0A562Q2R7_9PSED|nr:sulfite oxidase-like oxidoreductase [Pseudomonas duriflava]TWI50928.1 DMSO/TMAO reductase YedYZ molybdopterin-dependent catalytic subunit [Pseudomonas duriflava]
MSDDHDPEAPSTSKLIQAKQQWAREGRYLTGQVARPETERLPPGQHLVKNWPVLDLGVRPAVSRERWRLDVTGAAEKPQVWDWEGFMALPQSRLVSDIHCVTSWSRYDNQWQGVTTQDLLEAIRPRPEARFVLLYCNDGYTTNLSLDDFAAPGALLAHSWEGNPLTPEHGGPVRLIVPHLYFWKSAKWIRRIQFRLSDTPGYWEERGYHNRGDPWREERYSDD